MKASRIALWVWYRGDFFRGFQSQPQGPTVQGSIAQCLAAIGIRSSPCAAGRTDKGVHARMQVVSLRSAAIAPDDLVDRLSKQPLPGLGICYARSASDSFHAQWSSVGKEYRYRLRLDPRAREPWRSCSWSPSDHPRLLERKVDPGRLARVLRALEGTRDFAAFHESSSPRRLRTIQRCELVDAGAGLFDVRISGDRFARYQVRFMVGSAVAVAAGAIPEESFLRSLEEAEPLGGIKAPAPGLVLWAVHYPPAVDPFDARERISPTALPAQPPFIPLSA